MTEVWGPLVPVGKADVELRGWPVAVGISETELDLAGIPLAVEVGRPLVNDMVETACFWIPSSST